MTLSKDAIQSIRRHGLTATPKPCHCDHKRTGTGAVFYQSVGVLECTVCGGFQEIRKPIK